MSLLNVLFGPHGVDRYTELLDPMWTSEARATVVDVRRTTPRSVTLRLRTNRPVRSLAGQHVAVTVEIDGRRHTRYYSPANAEGAAVLELTIAVHDGGLVSEYLHRNAVPGMVVGLSEPGGQFVLPDVRPGRLLFIAGGSGITPVMAMLRTLRNEGFEGELAVLRYVRNIEDACYRDELAAMSGVRVRYACTRRDNGDLHGHLTAEHLAAAMEDPDAVYVCGPHALADAARTHCGEVMAESFTPPIRSDKPSGGRITFSDSGIEADDDGRPLLDQAEAAGLKTKSGCRMGICHTCTSRTINGSVRNLTTGAVSVANGQDVQICVSVPVGDVEIAL